MSTHAAQTNGFPKQFPGYELILCSGFGVSIFFVISGFIITHLLLREEEQSGRINLGQFYLRRAWRILPPVFAFLIFISVTAALGRSRVSAFELTSCILFFRNLISGSHETAHLWSLAIEEQFYLVWPVLVVFLTRKRRIPFLLLALCVAPIWRHVNVRLFGPQGFNPVRADLRYDFLAIGCLLALLMRSRLNNWLATGILSRNITISGCILVVALVMYSPNWRLPGVITFANQSVAAISVGVVVSALVRGKPRFLNAAMNSTPIVWIGLISYSLYLWQQPFCVAGSPLMLGYPTNIVISFVCATASYYGVEQLSRKARDWLHVRREPSAAVESTGVDEAMSFPDSRVLFKR